MLDGMVVFRAVDGKPPVFLEGISARWKEAAPKGRVICLKRGLNGETFCIMMLF